MTATPVRRLLVLLPAGTTEALALPLLQGASQLAARHGAPLDVIELRAEGEACLPVPALAAPAHWWRFFHGQLQQADAPAQLALLPEALAHLGWAAGTPSLMLLPAASGEEIAPRLAARLGGVALGRVAEVDMGEGAVQVTRPAWGGRALARLASAAGVCVACWRPTASAVAGSCAPTVKAHRLTTALPAAPQAQAVPSADALPALEGARLVVSGGRGMQGEAGFALLGRLAARLGAGLGGSLPAVDAGWVPVARQIGQSGKYVTPRAYFAVGISGTPQHLAGVSPEARIIAVNKDADAPIFGVAEAGVVADWAELLPLLCEQVEAQLAEVSPLNH